MTSLLILLAALPPDPCALRALVDKPGAELVPLVEKAPAGRARACISVVAAQALAREGHGSDAARFFDEAALVLTDIANFLGIAKTRATSSPAAPVVEKPPATAEDAAERVMRLVREAKPRQAVDVALALPRTPAPNEALEIATVTALARADRIEDAVARARALPDTDAFLKIRAWALAKAQHLQEARDVYARLASTTTDPALKAEAAFYAGFSAYESGDLDDAKARLSASADATRGTPFEPLARWYAAFADLVRGRPQDAAPTLAALVKDFPGDREVLKHRYWLAVALGDTAGLRALADGEPTDYYGLLARRRLKLKPLKGARVPADAVVKLARKDDEAGRARLLWNLGLDDEARTLARGLGEGTPEIGLQQELGDAAFGFRRGARFIPLPHVKAGGVVNDARWRVSYAMPWHATVDAAAKKYGLPSSFVYAIMRTESGFDARAVSAAGARGVIQLLPAAARGACALAGRPVDDAALIFEPDTAIDLGAALLGAEKRELGSLALAAAAYNGAAPNVAEWMKQWRALDVELFVERMPFRETRDYVKRVMATEALYRALDGEPLAIDLPAAIPAPPTSFTHFPTND